MFFVARFDKPIAADGENWLKFAPGQTVTMRVGISFVDEDGARRNLDAEAPPRVTFDAMRAHAYDAWNSELQRIRVSGGTVADKRTFYTALYHSLLHPNVFEDVDGRYRGFDDVIRTAVGRTQYANFSLWDTYKAENQLLATLHPDRYADMLRSLLADAEQQGYLPRWAEHNRDPGYMTGDPAIPMIADGLCRGLVGGADAQSLYDESVKLVGRRNLVATIHVYAGLALPAPLVVGWVRSRALRRDARVLNRFSPDDWAWLRARDRSVETIIDASGEPLSHALAAQPLIVKPNRAELERTVESPINSEAILRHTITKLLQTGPRWAVITEGKAGAMVSDGKRFWRVQSPPRPRCRTACSSTASTTASISGRPATSTTSARLICTRSLASRGRPRPSCAPRNRRGAPRSTGCPATTISAASRPGTSGRRSASGRSHPVLRSTWSARRSSSAHRSLSTTAASRSRRRARRSPASTSSLRRSTASR